LYLFIYYELILSLIDVELPIYILNSLTFGGKGEMNRERI